MKNLLRKKRNGNAGDLIGTSICLLALMIVFISFVHFCTLIEFKRNLNNVARDYLLKVETTGTLTHDEYDKMVADATALQPESSRGIGTYTVTANFNGNNMPAHYGENVSINITVNASYDALGLTQFYQIIKDNYVFSANYNSTSKK